MHFSLLLWAFHGTAVYSRTIELLLILSHYIYVLYVHLCCQSCKNLYS